MSDYERIARAMAFLVERAAEQPSLDAVAAHVHLSPYHFQRLFSRWAGTTPKRFLQALTVERGKTLLAHKHSLLETAHALGLSGGSRLYDLFVKLEALTPGEYKNQGRDVPIVYGVHDTPLGPMLVAKTARGVCRAEFLEGSEQSVVAELKSAWPYSQISENPAMTAAVIEAFFTGAKTMRSGPLSLHVAGTNFQIAVWRALLKIPPGTLTSYAQIANLVGKPKAARAVGNAIGANPVALLIPCHRVIQQSGALGGYRWGAEKKLMAQTWERLRAEPLNLPE